MLSRGVLSAWAKYRRSTGESLSLVRHCEDAAAVAAHLWDDWLPGSTKALLAGESSLADARTLGRFLAGTHDVGKLSPAFALQVDELCGPMRDAGLRFPRFMEHRADAPHALVSFTALVAYLSSRHHCSEAVAKTYAVVAGGHHGQPPTERQAGPRGRSEMHYGDARWEEARAELIDHIADVVGARDLIARWVSTPLTDRQQALWTAFVIMADWIASSDLFSLSERTDSVEPAAAAWELLDLPGPWRAHPPDELAQLVTSRFDLPVGATPNPMQDAVVETARAMEEPGMLIVEATMGSGKTEAALAAAEYLAAKFELGGVFVALPTMATSNAMFSRVHTWLHNQDPDSVTSLNLAHGKAFLNDEFAAVPRESAMVGIDFDGDAGLARSCRAEVIAHQWFFGRKRAMLADFVVGTIDQLLFAGLKAKHVVLRHLSLANKVVILDEVHAADDYMRQYLIRVLEWLAAYRVPVILLSATLPSAQRLELVRAYERGRGWSGAGACITGDIGYPVVTSVGEQRGLVGVPLGASTAIRLQRLNDDDDQLVELIAEAIADGGCVGIIRNTVRRAQDTARLLRERFGGDVVLLHSRFVAQHRADLEADLVGELGRTGNRPHRRIVVATQVIEQSLDLDFDLLVSDLAPIDLVLQRLGRLHRHPRERHPRLVVPTLVLTGPAEWTVIPPVLERGAVSVYGESRILRSAAVLDGRDTITVPDDIPVLVQAAYANDFEPPAGWTDAVIAADEVDATRVTAQREKADLWRLWGPLTRDCLVDWLAASAGDVDDPRGYAKVRDSEEGVEVLITQRVGGDVYLLAQCGRHRLDVDFAPSTAVARKVLGSAIRLPAELCRTEQIDDTIRELEGRMYGGWQDSGWLAGELAIELDEGGVAEVQGYRLRYDDAEGLVIQKAQA